MDTEPQDSGEPGVLPEETPPRPVDRRRWGLLLVVALIGPWPADRRRWVLLLVIALTVCGLDQASKAWADSTLFETPGRTIQLVEGYAAFSYVRNPGAAWGLLSGASDAFRFPFFVAMTSLAMAFMLYIFIRLEPDQRWLMVALALILGGAMGNFIDRVRFNYVIDFILLHYQMRFRWPTFNVADVGITAGVIMMLGEMLLGPWLLRRRMRTAGLAPAPAAEPLPRPDVEE